MLKDWRYASGAGIQVISICCRDCSGHMALLRPSGEKIHGAPSAWPSMDHLEKGEMLNQMEQSFHNDGAWNNDAVWAGTAWTEALTCLQVLKRAVQRGGHLFNILIEISWFQLWSAVKAKAESEVH
ncbi:hypothetical protein F0562_026812 [Nyssa sinensis]|uniref:Uncharacterized protein n=1 Tax=Nyssa sinensis TaxID=561372 RepID=A0A5J5BCM5_9ASTE|nr:hypothetical protein F0562_026812 [Nyssa sinensis]